MQSVGIEFRCNSAPMRRKIGSKGPGIRKFRLIWGEATMAEVGTRAPRVSLRHITGYKWLVRFVAWAGWSLAITDFTLYGLVLRQALTELLGGTATMAQIGSVGGLLTTIGLLGWAVGGL